MNARDLAVSVFAVVFLLGAAWWPLRLRAGYPRRSRPVGMAQRPRVPVPARHRGALW